jgi:hypothetical protein
MSDEPWERERRRRIKETERRLAESIREGELQTWIDAGLCPEPVKFFDPDWWLKGWLNA